MTQRPDDGIIDPADSDFFRLAGKRLRSIRKIAGINQTLVAARLRVDQSTWSKWETGKRIPNPAKVAKFAARAKTSLSFIYEGLPIGTHPILLRLLRASAPELVAEEPSDTDQSTDTALASYRSSIHQAISDLE
jgi:transcriptional regulator with XRE-family HTH domain